MQSNFGGTPSKKMESLSVNTPPKPQKPRKDKEMPEGFSMSEDGKIICMHPGCGKTFTRLVIRLSDNRIIIQNLDIQLG